MGNEKASIEKQNRTLQAQLSDVQRKCDEANLILGDYDNAKKKVVIENADLLRQVMLMYRVVQLNFSPEMELSSTGRPMSS